MAIKRINENPTVTDRVLFDILCPGDDDCFRYNPYKVDNVTVYYIERDFTNNPSEYTSNIPNYKLEEELKIAQQKACETPSEENLLKLQSAKEKTTISELENTFYYKNAKPVLIVGSEATPAWLNPDEVPPEEKDQVIKDNRLVLIDENAEGLPQFGTFELNWIPIGMREGDYFCCWTWTPYPNGASYQAHEQFTLYGNTLTNTSIPSHYTNPDKYKILLDRYLPSMFKEYICSTDMTPQVIQELNKCVADGFSFTENLANQMVDILDANMIHESFLELLAGMFNLKLRSNDPTRWRRQIKSASTLFKKKGTLDGLIQGLAQAGIKLNKFTRLWQILPQGTWQESFNTSEGQTEFTLSKAAIINYDNINLYYRGAEDIDWTELSPAQDYIYINNDENLLPGCSDRYLTITKMTWLGEELSVEPIIFENGDSIRISYQTRTITDETIENYIKNLPLADQRDERLQNYPLKNWNLRVIEEDDPYFDVVIPTRHPYHDPVYFGWVRTEFAYSENIYNMDEYNGSARESMNPCDIDRDFMDLCSGGQSSLFNVDLEIEELSNDRIKEAQEIIKEYVPFHAVLHSMLVNGSINEFIISSNETIDSYISITDTEYTISGNGQHIFNRVMTSKSLFDRESLSQIIEEVEEKQGYAYNSEIKFYSPDERLENIGLSLNNVLEVLAPSFNAGIYTLTDAKNNFASISGISTPLDSTSFSFRLSNDIYQENVKIYQEFLFSDDNIDFQNLWDSTAPSIEYDGSWSIILPNYPHDDGNEYSIVKIDSRNNLLIDNFLKSGSTLSSINTSSINYTLKNGEGETISSSSTGEWIEGNRGLVDITNGELNTISMNDIRNIISIDNFLLFNGSQYRVIEFLKNNPYRFYINNYTEGTVSGQNIHVYSRLIDSALGYFHYYGLNLTDGNNYENSLGILNGANSPADPNLILENDHFKENFIVEIESNGEIDYYAISEIDGDRIYLSGPHYDWGLRAEINSQNVIFKISRFNKVEQITIPERTYPNWPGANFRVLDRRGNEVIEVHNSDTNEITGLGLLAASAKNSRNEILSQKESITVQID